MTIFPAILAAIAMYLLVGVAFRWNTRRPKRPPRSPRPTPRVTLESRLRQAGVGLSPGRYRATVAGSMAATFIVAYAATATAPLALVPTVVVGAAPRAFYRRRHDKMLAARVAAWPEAIRDVLTHLGVDNTLHRALVQLGDSGPAPLRPVWQRYARNASVLDTPAALAQVRAELADPVSDHVLEAFEAAYDRGQSTSLSVLGSLADHVTRDVQLREEIITSQAETRSQAVIAIVLPFALLAFLVVTNDAFRRFYSRPFGWVVIGVGATMAFAGWKLISVLGRIPVDPRLLVRKGPRL